MFNRGTFRLFRAAGIEVTVHWSWFLVAVIEIEHRSGYYGSPLWNALEYLALFGLVLLHEFGHALACRSVGGRAGQIVLWPLGGVAMVSPPPRPGPVLWSIAAGPLVNVAMVPVLSGVGLLSRACGAPSACPDLDRLLAMLAFINVALLVFNLLPIYPLDGGQILRALLWFPLGPDRSLTAAAAVGLVGVGLLALLAIAMKSVWIGIIAAFLLANCWRELRRGLTRARES